MIIFFRKQFLKLLAPPGIKLIPNSVMQRRKKPTTISDTTVSCRPTYLQFREVNFNESTGWFAATRWFFPRMWRQVDSNYCNRTQSLSAAATQHPLAMANVNVNGTTFKTNVLDSSTLKFIKNNKQKYPLYPSTADLSYGRCRPTLWNPALPFLL
jgi:hypothetical protein